MAWLLVVYRGVRAIEKKADRHAKTHTDELRTDKENHREQQTWLCNVTAMTTAERQLLLVEVIFAEGKCWLQAEGYKCGREAVCCVCRMPEIGGPAWVVAVPPPPVSIPV